MINLELFSCAGGMLVHPDRWDEFCAAFERKVGMPPCDDPPLTDREVR